MHILDTSVHASTQCARKNIGLCSPLPRQEANAGSRAGQLDQSSRGLESSCQLHVLGLAFLISLSIVNCLAGEALDGPRPYTLRLGTFQ